MNRVPDVVATSRWRHLDLFRVRVPVAPDIAVEALSPSEHIMASPAKFGTTGALAARRFACRAVFQRVRPIFWPQLLVP